MIHVTIILWFYFIITQQKNKWRPFKKAPFVFVNVKNLRGRHYHFKFIPFYGFFFNQARGDFV